MRSALVLQSVSRDLRHTLRSLRRDPVFTFTAVLAIALGIGACTAVFSVVDRILFRDLPYRDDSRLVSVGVTAPIENQEFMLGHQYFDWKDHQTPFASMTSWSGIGDCDITTENPVRLSCARVAANFLPTFGVLPSIGRNFSAEEDRPAGARVALISYGLWRSRFGARRDIVGNTFSLDGKSTQILGVLPKEFELPSLASADILVPQALDEAAQRSSPQGAVLHVFARLKSGVTMQQADAQLEPLFHEFLKSVPPQFRKEVKLKLRSVRDREFHDSRTASWLLLMAVLAILLISCANVASLLLARATGREKELAVRTALGARPAHLMQTAFIESVFLGLVGGAGGCLLGFFLIRFFVAIAPAGIPRIEQAGMDLRALLFTAAASLTSGLIFGLAPALRSLSPGPVSGNTVTTPRSRLQPFLITAQIAVSMVLLSSAGLLLRSFWKVENQPLGIQTGKIVTADITLNQNTYPGSEQQRAFFEQVENRLKQMPGVQHLAVSDSLPPGLSRFTLYAGLIVEGRPRFAGGTGGQVAWRIVTPEYFSALGVPIIEGRGFREEDRDPAQGAIVLSHSLAQRLFPGEDPVGKRIQVNSSPPWLTVIGVAGDAKNNGITSAALPEYYLVRRHAPDFGMADRFPPGSLRHAVVFFRATAGANAAAWLRDQVHDIDPTVPVTVLSMDERVGALTQKSRFDATLLSLFAAIGVLLAGIGLYGVISFVAAQRTREIGVRMALGATRGSIMTLVLSHAVRWAVLGVFTGILSSLASGKILRSLLFQTSARDPLIFMAAAFVLVLAAFAASSVPARRAAFADPIAALRSE
jgi:putative ABC transport system permease protein